MLSPPPRARSAWWRNIRSPIASLLSGLTANCRWKRGTCRIKSHLAAPLGRTWLGEIAPPVLLFLRRFIRTRNHFQDCKARSGHHAIPFWLGYVAPCLGGGLGVAAEIRRERLMIMVEELRELFCRYFLDRHQNYPFSNRLVWLERR